jgi:hypothetical protein
MELAHARSYHTMRGVHKVRVYSVAHATRLIVLLLLFLFTSDGYFNIKRFYFLFYFFFHRKRFALTVVFIINS